jgi:TrmH family RNA methyltransferase
MERIASRQNAIVKRFRDLARASSASPEVLLDGAHLVEEAVACGVPIEVAAFSDRQPVGARSSLSPIAQSVKRQGGRVLSVSDAVLAAMSPVQQPSGVVAIARAKRSDIASVFAPHAGARPHRSAVRAPLVVVLAGLQDPGNVGAIIRSCSAFGATGVVTIEGTANPFGWKALRGGMGATFHLQVAPGGTLLDVIAAAKHAGVPLLAAVPRGGTPLPEVDLRGPFAMIMGGEGAGIADTATAAAQRLITIPMQPPVESLNVATAAALILYEAVRQRSTVARSE